jgi:radical SAM protein with 4Fe4S-binding SPASM domain
VFNEGYIIVREYNNDIWIAYNKNIKRMAFFQGDLYFLHKILDMYKMKTTDEKIIAQMRNEYYEEDMESLRNDCLDTLDIIKNIFDESSCESNKQLELSTDDGLGDIEDKIIHDYAAENLIPYSFDWEIAGFCNLDCLHCYCSNSGNRHNPTWTLDRAKNLVDSLYEYGAAELTLTGGECLYHPDINEILRYIDRKGFIVTLLTNGTLIDEEMADLIASIKPRNVQFSVYSLDWQIHEEITRVYGSLKRTLQGIELLIERGVTVSIATPIMDINISGLSEIREWANAKQLKIGFTYMLSPSSNERNNPIAHGMILGDRLPEIFNDPKYHAKLDLIIKEPHRGLRRVQEGDKHLCQGGFRKMFVSADGNVSPCNGLRYSFGNVFEQSLSDIWHGKNAAIWRNITIEDYPKCVACEAKNYCEPCPAIHFATTGDLYGIDEQTCKYGRAVHSYIKELGIV